MNLERERPDISFLVPTLNEVDWIYACISAIKASCASANLTCQIIICDGGSVDGTPEMARSRGAIVVEGALGRAAQVNAGATVATGELLVMLHADVLIQPDALVFMQSAVRSKHVGGFFQIRIDPQLGRAPNLLNAMAWGINLRTRRFQTATADQAIFATREAWDQVGGVPELPLMEGLAFVRALRTVGSLAVLPPLIRISGRRWERNGVLRTWLKAYAIRLAYESGVDPQELADFW